MIFFTVFGWSVLGWSQLEGAAGGLVLPAGLEGAAGGLVLPAELNAAQFLIQILAPNECLLVNSNFGTKWMRTYARLPVLSSCIHTTE